MQSTLCLMFNFLNEDILQNIIVKDIAVEYYFLMKDNMSLFENKINEIFENVFVDKIR